MSRAGILTALRNYSPLTSVVPANAIVPNYSRDERPSKDGPFIIIRWEESTLYSQTYTGMSNGLDRAPRTITVWAHVPRENTTDFWVLDNILNLVDDALVYLEHVDGGDGYTITCVRKSGRSRDLVDEGYNTITRNAAYGVLSRATV